MSTFLLTAITMLAFAANSLLCRLALAEGLIDAGSFTLVRLISGAITLIALLVVRGQWKTDRPTSRFRFFAGVALFGYAALFSFAYLQLATGTGALLLFGAVQLTLLAIYWWQGERFQFLEIMPAEWVRRKQSVVPRMPPGGMARVGGMFEQRNADHAPTGQGSAVIYPRRPFAPGIGPGIAVRVDQPAGARPLVLAFAVGDTEGFVDPYGHRSLLGVAQRHRAVGGEQLHFVIEPGGVALARDPHRGLIREQWRAIRRFPATPGAQQPRRAVAGLKDAFEGDPPGFLFGQFTPKVVPVDQTMGEPHSAVPIVIGHFRRIGFERIVARVTCAVGVENRVKAGLRPARVDVVREVTSADLDPHAVRLRGEGDCIRGPCGGSGEQAEQDDEEAGGDHAARDWRRVSGASQIARTPSA